MALAIILCVAIIVGAFAIFGNINASATVEFDETNPDLKLECIDSDLENSFYSQGIYTQTTKFTQTGNGSEGGSYHMNTNAYCVWVKDDDVAFAYKEYPVGNTGTDYVEAEVTIPRKATSTGKNSSSTKNELHQNSSIGIMIRSSLDPQAAETFVHLRGSNVLVVYRTNTGDTTKVQYTGMSLTFPCKLKLRKAGNQVTLYYQSGKSDFKKFNYPVAFGDTGPLYVGLAAHSCDAETYIDADFKDFKVKGSGSWTSDGSGEDNTPSKTESVYTEVDTPVASDTLMRETFTANDLTERKKASVTAPIWNYKQAPTIENLNGNMVWHRNFVDEANYAGAELGTWYDYEVSAKVQFTENCDPDPDNAQNMFALLARHTENLYYGACDYAVVIRNGYNLSLQKRIYKNNTYEEIKDISAYDASIQLGETVNLRDLEGNEYYPDVTEYFLTSDKAVNSKKTYYSYSKSMGYSLVAEPKDSEIATYYEAKTVKGTENKWTCLGDGEFHELKIRVFDNIITGYWDGQEVIKYVDDNPVTYRNTFTIVHTKGEIGIVTFETDCYVDDILVTKLEDPLGGDYDNFIEGNWNQAIPEYLESWTEKTGDSYLK